MLSDNGDNVAGGDDGGAAEGGRPVAFDQKKAWMPVWARPRIRAWTSCVPS